MLGNKNGILLRERCARQFCTWQASPVRGPRECFPIVNNTAIFWTRRPRTKAAALSNAGQPPRPPNHGGDGGGGGGGSGGWQARDEASHTALQAGQSTSEDMLLLDITGMHCGGCVSKVKKLLESHPNVTQANVNLATEVALVKILLVGDPVALRNKEARQTSLQSIADQLIKALARMGFKGKPRDPKQGSAAAAAAVKARREERVR